MVFRFFIEGRVDGGFVPLDPLLGLCPGPAGDLKKSPDPSPTHAPLIPNPGSAPDNCLYSNTERGRRGRDRICVGLTFT